MKDIRNVKFRFIAAVLSLVYSMGIAHAQEHGPSMDSAGTANKIDTKQSSYVIPQKAEDISPLLNGEKIPIAMLTDASGKKFDLNKAISEKPTILIFYRGGWCPYCSKELSGLQQAAPDLQKSGYQLIAISTDAPEGLIQSAKTKMLSYTLLSDADLSLSKQVGIAYKAPKGYWEMLPKTTGGKDPDLLLPVPSVFIVDKTGVIHFEYINPDATTRLGADLLKVVANTIVKDL